MNRRTSSSIYSLLLIISVTLTGCTPPATPTSVPVADDITITNLVENPQIAGQIVQTKVYNQCESASPLKAQIQFSESNTSSQQKELVISAGVSGEVGLSVAAKVEIQGSIEQHFASVNTTEKGYQEVIDIEIPAHTKQEYNITWKETRSEGTIEYSENGVIKSVDYSYRIGLQFADSIVKNIPCPLPVTLTPSEAPIPSATPLARQTLADGCIFSETWNVHSTDANALENTAVGLNGCRSLSTLGISAEAGGPLHIFLTEKKVARSARIYTPITQNTVLELSDIKLSVYINGVRMQEQLSLPNGDKLFYIDYNMPILSGLDLQINNLSFDGEIR